MIQGAEFNSDRSHRYALWRIWNQNRPLVMFIGLNPSSAAETHDDPTIKRVVKIAYNLGYGGVYMMNLFSVISTDPSKLIPETDFNMTDSWLYNVRKTCQDVIFAWGNFEVARKRAAQIGLMFPDALALVINKNGSPKHPLYVNINIQPVKYQNS